MDPESASPDAPTFAWEDLLKEPKGGFDFSELDEMAGEMTERLLARAEAYWKARTNEIFVRNRPELIQDLARLDAINLQTMVLSHRIQRAQEAIVAALQTSKDSGDSTPASPKGS